MQTLYTTQKVNNEIELCEIVESESRAHVEKSLLAARISYFIRWPKTTIFNRRKDICIVCVNENSAAEAESIITGLVEDFGYDVRFLRRPTQNSFL